MLSREIKKERERERFFIDVLSFLKRLMLWIDTKIRS